MNTREYVAAALPTREQIDRFLDAKAHNWACYDGELGYLPNTSTVRDGMDGAYSVYTYPKRGGKTRERLLLNYPDKQSRLNTYGDSFTQCHQVSDGETWQEYLAAHFGEPIRNFGVGGYGVYQAYLRMLREEATDASASHVILNVWIDDHVRSLYPWRWLHIAGFRSHESIANPPRDSAWMYHCTPWRHLSLDLDDGGFHEEPSACPTAKSLYDLCDIDFAMNAFAENFAVQVQLVKDGVDDVAKSILRRAADALRMECDLSDRDAMVATADALMIRASLLSSIQVVKWARTFCDERDKRLMVLLSYSATDVIHACKDEPRWDRSFAEWVSDAGLPMVDTLNRHVRDYAAFNLTPEEYAERFYMGHYSPIGNHFFAFAIKDTVADWMSPPPRTYREGGPRMADQAGKLA